MAFTGTPVVKKVSDRLYRITGVSLAGGVSEGASGTIGLNTSPNGPPGPGEIDLLTPEWQPYDDVTLQDAVYVLINSAELDSESPNGLALNVEKTGSTHADFLITLQNSGGAEGPSTPELEIYVGFH